MEQGYNPTRMSTADNIIYTFIYKINRIIVLLVFPQRKPNSHLASRHSYFTIHESLFCYANINLFFHIIFSTLKASFITSFIDIIFITTSQLYRLHISLTLTCIRSTATYQRPQHRHPHTQ